MKIRIASAVVAVILLITVIVLGREALGISVFILSVIGLHEFYHAVSNAGYKPVRVIGYIACLPQLFFIIGPEGSVPGKYLSRFNTMNGFALGIFVILFILFTLTIFKHEKYNINDIALTVFGVFYIPFLFSFLTLTRNLNGGAFYIWLIFIGAWATDTSAYFTGVLMGKNKLLPAISPKKTVEGSIGGIIGCMAIAAVYGIIQNRNLGFVPVYHFIIIGILSGVISQIGDWAASAVKRYVRIKDYGNLMPGHGGVLDRFDSILFVAPTVYFYIVFFIR